MHKSNMVDGHHLIKCHTVRPMHNWDRKQNRTPTDHVTKIATFENSRWQITAILKMVISQYLSHYSRDFDEIWYADFDSEDVHENKNQNFINPRWHTDAILKIFSATSPLYDSSCP